jgi:hypothetical protein
VTSFTKSDGKMTGPVQNPLGPLGVGNLGVLVVVCNGIKEIMIYGKAFYCEKNYKADYKFTFRNSVTENCCDITNKSGF